MAIYITADRHKDCMVVLSANHEHNHPTGPDLFRKYPENRHLDSEEYALGKSMMGLKVKVHVTTDKLRAVYGKAHTNVNIHNIHARIQKEMSGRCSAEE